MKTKELRTYLTTKIKDITGLTVAYSNANDEMDYPYLTYEISDLVSDTHGKHIMDLTVDAWAMNVVEDIENAIDKLDEKFDQYKDNTNDFLVCIYLGGVRQNVKDDDKQIRRIQRNYEMIIWERKV